MHTFSENPVWTPYLWIWHLFSRIPVLANWCFRVITSCRSYDWEHHKATAAPKIPKPALSWSTKNSDPTNHNQENTTNCCQKTWRTGQLLCNVGFLLAPHDPGPTRLSRDIGWKGPAKWATCRNLSWLQTLELTWRTGSQRPIESLDMDQNQPESKRWEQKTNENISTQTSWAQHQHPNLSESIRHETSLDWCVNMRQCPFASYPDTHDGARFCASTEPINISLNRASPRVPTCWSFTPVSNSLQPAT